MNDRLFLIPKTSEVKVNKGNIFKVISVVAIILALFIFAVAGPSSCTDEDGARRVLSQNGYKNITITGYRWWMKGEDDVYCTGFEATSPSGERVTGAVTGGWAKGRTIRFD